MYDYLIICQPGVPGCRYDSISAAVGVGPGGGCGDVAVAADGARVGVAAGAGVGATGAASAAVASDGAIVAVFHVSVVAVAIPFAACVVAAGAGVAAVVAVAVAVSLAPAAGADVGAAVIAAAVVAFIAVVVFDAGGDAGVGGCWCWWQSGGSAGADTDAGADHVLIHGIGQPCGRHSVRGVGAQQRARQITTTVGTHSGCLNGALLFGPFSDPRLGDHFQPSVPTETGLELTLNLMRAMGLLCVLPRV